MRAVSQPVLFEGTGSSSPPVTRPKSAGSRRAQSGRIPSFSFIDLFAGIGGFRIALSSLGGRCVFTSEWDKYAQKTYEAWYGDRPHGDINAIAAEAIPDHDVLCAGFPCQPFSIAGVSKKNSLGQAHGFRCKRQGNLFFKICDIAAAKRPGVLFLENVKNLRNHDSGKTWTVIQAELDELGYELHHKVIDARHWVPQHRERIFIVGFDRKRFGKAVPFEFPKLPTRVPKLGSILEPSPDAKYVLTDHLWKYLQNYAAKHRAAGNGFGYGLVGKDDVTRTLSARYHKDGSEILVRRGSGRPRRLTPRECARLMGYGEGVAMRFGFEDGFPMVVSDTQAYRQFGNSVVPAVVEAVAAPAVRLLRQSGLRSQLTSSCDHALFGSR